MLTACMQFSKEAVFLFQQACRRGVYSRGMEDKWVLSAQEEDMKRKEGLLDERPWGMDVLQAYMDKQHDA